MAKYVLVALNGPTPDGSAVPAPLNVEALRKDFPLLTRQVNGRPVVYLDSASSAIASSLFSAKLSRQIKSALL